LLENLRRYRSVQDSVRSSFSRLEGAYKTLKVKAQTPAKAKVDKLLHRLDAADDARQDGEENVPSASSSPASSSSLACYSSPVEDALASENVHYQELRSLEKELMGIVRLLRRDFEVLVKREEPPDHAVYWDFVSGVADALDAVERDCELKRRIIGNLDWHTPEEDCFVYNVLLSLQPFLKDSLFDVVESAGAARLAS